MGNNSKEFALSHHNHRTLQTAHLAIIQLTMSDSATHCKTGEECQRRALVKRLQIEASIRTHAGEGTMEQ